jgi:hypothetical protein
LFWYQNRPLAKQLGGVELKYLKVGDLVKSKRASRGTNRRRGDIGVVIAVEQTKKPGPAGQLAQVKWAEGYGAFYNHRPDLCLISEAK